MDSFDWYGLTLKKDAWTMCDAAVLFETINGEELYRTGIINEDDDKDGIGFTFKHLFETSIACNKLIPCGIAQGWLVYNPMDVIQWAISKEIPMPPRLQEWWKKQNKSIEESSAVNNQDDIKTDGETELKPQPRKKLKPMVRATTESLQLIYAIAKAHNVEYDDDLSGEGAWSLILSEKFTSTFILKKPENTRDTLVLNDKEELTKSAFIKKWNERFE